MGTTTIKVDQNGNIITPQVQQEVKVMLGTDPGNYYRIVGTSHGATIGFRNLNDKVSLGEPFGQLRVRVEGVPAPSAFVGYLNTLGFTRKSAGHFSAVMGADQFLAIADQLGLSL